MKIVLATPLYPPDTEQVAQYNKELAFRLASQKKLPVTVVTYGKFPEQTPFVSVVSTDKRMPTFVRLSVYTLKLLTALRKANILYVQNGSSVELPTLFASIVTATPFVILDTDKNATTQSSSHKITALISKTLRKRAKGIIIEIPEKKPEVLPFSPYPEKEFASYEKSWDEHLHKIESFIS